MRNIVPIRAITAKPSLFGPSFTCTVIRFLADSLHNKLWTIQAYQVPIFIQSVSMRGLSFTPVIVMLSQLHQYKKCNTSFYHFWKFAFTAYLNNFHTLLRGLNAYSLTLTTITLILASLPVKASINYVVL